MESIPYSGIAMFLFIQWEHKNDLKIRMQIAEDLWDSRLYVIKANMCAGEEEKYKEEMQKKMKRLHVMSTVNCSFSHAPSPTLPGWFLILRFTAWGYYWFQMLASASAHARTEPQPP